MDTLHIAHPALATLANGIGWDCFVYGLLGVLLHLLLKLSDGITTAQKESATFNTITWFMKNKIYIVITLVSGMLSIFLVQQYWSPTTVSKSIIVGFAAGSAIYNLWSIINSPDTWSGLFKAFLPGKK